MLIYNCITYKKRVIYRLLFLNYYSIVFFHNKYKYPERRILQELPNISNPSFAYSGLKNPSTNLTNHQVMKNVTATGKRTTLQIKRGIKQVNRLGYNL